MFNFYVFITAVSRQSGKSDGSELVTDFYSHLETHAEVVAEAMKHFGDLLVGEDFTLHIQRTSPLPPTGTETAEEASIQAAHYDLKASLKKSLMT